MIRKMLVSLGIAAVLVVFLAVTVAAQATPEADEETTLPSIEPFEASIVQALPLSLTVRIPGETGVQTVVVPLTLTLDIRLGFGTVVTASVAATTEAVIVPSTPVTEEVEATTPEPTEEPATPTPRPTVAPTATPRPVATNTPVSATATPTVTAAPTATATSAVQAAVCPDPHAVITSPGVNAVLSGQVDIIGTAQHENFNYYKLEYAQGVDPNTEFAFLTDARTQVVNGLLGIFDTTTVDNGLYMLRLIVVDNTGNFPPPCMVTVVIDN